MGTGASGTVCTPGRLGELFRVRVNLFGVFGSLQKPTELFKLRLLADYLSYGRDDGVNAARRSTRSPAGRSVREVGRRRDANALAERDELGRHVVVVGERASARIGASKFDLT